MRGLLVLCRIKKRSTGRTGCDVSPNEIIATCNTHDAFLPNDTRASG